MIVIAEVYIGFSVAEGRPEVIAVEVRVATAFAVLAAMAITGPAWLVVAGLRTESRTSGSTEPASSQTHDGGHRSAPPWTGSPLPCSPPR
jgi:hypothetical protein